MMDSINTYLSRVENRLKTGIAREHAYRGDLEQLLRSLLPTVEVINEPSEVTDCGNPDFVITARNIPIGFIEAKDVGKDLNAKQYKEQFDRYRKALPNLIITNYLDFEFYEDGERVLAVCLGDTDGHRIRPKPDTYDAFCRSLRAFRDHTTDTIRSPEKLAQMMADRARLLESILASALESDDSSQRDSELKAQYKTFKHLLIHDMTTRQFADIYAQTLAYGLFAARLNDDSLENFSRIEAGSLIPKSNPFLRRLFQYIAGPDIDVRILPIVEHLVAIFRHTNVSELLQNFGKSTAKNDPIIHFYETFLAAYDPKLRKSRGVYYTPEPVVDFIVRAVNELLKSKFGLQDGLADTSKTTITVDTTVKDLRTASGYKQAEEEIHRVQILDPATGTGTFLAQIIKVLYEETFQNMSGIWSSYIERELIPRLHGFEFLMAPYAMAHLKLDLLLKQTGYRPSNPVSPPRLNIYLTNSLEPYHPDTGTLFAQWLSSESEQANRVKRDVPVMVTLGNPPYSGHSVNKGRWVTELLDSYKQEPSGGKLQEKNSKWLNDDYVKFIRYGQHYVEKNGKGILAYINNNSFLDNPTFRGMRWHLLKCFDEIYILDLHGSTKKKESAPDGSKDENVFDIQQGVSINIFVKTGKKTEDQLASLFHHDVFGPRAQKYDCLWKGDIGSISWVKITPSEPMYFFVPRDNEREIEYGAGFSIADLFSVNSVGIITARDEFTIHHTKDQVRQIINAFVELETEQARTKFNLREDVRDWKVHLAQADVRDSGLQEQNIVPIAYRPFDNRFTYFTGHSKGFHCMPRGEVMRNFLRGNNIALVSCRQTAVDSWEHVAITSTIVDDSFVSNRTKERGYVFPLFLYPQGSNEPVANLDESLIKRIEDALGLKYSASELSDSRFSPLDLLDYIYAVLHSPKYRWRYRVLLKSDFPRIPYPSDQNTFRQLVKFGAKLREVHLLEHAEVNELITGYPEHGDNLITGGAGKSDFKLVNHEGNVGQVWINDHQYFDRVPQSAWDFYIGGYQPARKWIKDRKGQKLDYDGIRHYQKIIKALALTIEIMEDIDKLEFLP